ncbi:serine/threonine-protein kinase [Actinomadura algeriensis]|uniref:Serine/threonine protein kinase n=1 Tax=Actinomadura algeriensis TaxID=1679523 RepID=A0ABR9JPX0_9ACTN|nr:serine/threonine-protein kinase [Actinomadura algeriensis]MBE1532628.1 serine/threonine protein kinase [Actinomadura algeriensis]
MEPLDRSDPRRIGERITLRGRLGAGGMGRVYYGVTDDHEQVAVKVIKADLVDRDEVRERFARETDALRTLQGPHLASLVDASGADDDEPWLAMEYVRGLTLSEFVKTRGPLPVPVAAVLGVLLAGALRDVHAAGLLHRDLKPGNVLLGRDGPKVIDFGLVAFADGPSDLTTSKSMLGTPHCMPPEQMQTPKEITAAADVYALGATLLFALTKHYPYEAETIHGLIGKVISAHIGPDLGGVPDAFTGPVAAMLAYGAGDRPPLPALVHDLSGMCGPVPEAITAFALATYVKRESDPADVAPPRRSRTVPSAVTPPGSVLAGLADRLRTSYAVSARF